MRLIDWHRSSWWRRLCTVGCGSVAASRPTSVSWAVSRTCWTCWTGAARAGAPAPSRSSSPRSTAFDRATRSSSAISRSTTAASEVRVDHAACRNECAVRRRGSTALQYSRHTVRRLPSAVRTATPAFHVRSSGLFCGRPGGLELVTRLPSRSVTFLWQLCDTIRYDTIRYEMLF